jgi:hypothetical protein
VKADPLFASEATAARLLDLKLAAFRDLVAKGHLPPPVLIGPVERFDMAEVQAILRGDKITAGGMSW